MMKSLGFFLFSFALTQANAQSFYTSKSLTGHDEGLQVGAGLTTAYSYNVFYSDANQVNDLSTIVQPVLAYNSVPRTLAVHLLGEGIYEKFARYGVQDHVDYHGLLEIPVRTEGGLELKIAADYRSFSDRADRVDSKRWNRSTSQGEVGIKVPLSTSQRVGLRAGVTLEQFREYEQQRFTHTNLDGVFYYEQNFLPETRWFIRGTGGMTDYPTPNIASEKFDYVIKKTNSVYGLGEIGLIGRLTDRSSVDAAFGFLQRQYSDTAATHFTEPVFYLRFLEQVTRRDQLMGGFNYVVQDSYFTNYFIDQEIFIGAGRLVGDQVLLLTRMAYSYRTYSSPFRRDDQRVTASFSGKYSISRGMKLTGDLAVDVLNSDTYNNADASVDPDPDRAASYRAARLSLGILAEF